jgi:Lrp/AsnC family transcriptional regulator, leucine-responsive regulatory protein
MMEVRMDKLDFLVLNELLKDGTLSFVEIAKNIGSTPYTVRRRYEKMKKDGLIFRCTASIDLSKLGYQGKAFLLITVTPNSNKAETLEYIKSIRNIMVVTEIMGPYDILAIAPITDLNSVKSLVNEAKKAPQVQRVEMACIDDVSFPIGANFGTMLSQKSVALASTKE